MITMMITFIRYIEQTGTNTAENKTTILIVDKSVRLVIELKDDYKEVFEEAIGFSIYSNSQTAVCIICCNI